jgi:hypothetical protein
MQSFELGTVTLEAKGDEATGLVWLADRYEEGRTFREERSPFIFLIFITFLALYLECLH